MKLIIDIPDKDYEKLKDGHIPFSILDVMQNGIPIPDDASNGDVIKVVFPFPQHRIPLYQLNDAKNSTWALLDDKTESSWWNAPYKESE